MSSTTTDTNDSTDASATTERVEQFETGVRLHVRSTRGTGTRDQDKVSAEGHFETMEQLEANREHLVDACMNELNRLRQNQPDEEEA